MAFPGFRTQQLALMVMLRRMSKFRAFTAAVACVMMSVLAAGCSSGDDGDGGASGPGEVIAAYFDGMGGGDAGAMLAAASPGSPAAGFANYWADLIELGKATAYEVSTTDTEARLTRKSSEGDEGDVTIQQAPQVITPGDAALFTDFTYDSDGLIRTWTETPGGPLQPRVSAASKAAKVGRVELTIRNQYQMSDGTLWVNAQANNPANQTVDLVGATYLTPKEGESRELTIGDAETSGAVTLESQTSKILYFQVDGAETIGGTLVVYELEDSFLMSAEASIKLPNN
jgi:hypothetical protein